MALGLVLEVEEWVHEPSESKLPKLAALLEYEESGRLAAAESPLQPVSGL